MLLTEILSTVIPMLHLQLPIVNEPILTGNVMQNDTTHKFTTVQYAQKTEKLD